MTGAPSAEMRELHSDYRPHLDAVRGLAILGVLAFHAESSVFPGGALGVDAFFVLSAYLITSLLLRERGRAGRVDLQAFYLRRALRLMPALLLFTLVIALPIALSRGAQEVRTSVATTLVYLNDFTRAGLFWTPPSQEFAHTWSLAVEEQFYLVWPALLLGGARRGWLGTASSRRRLVTGTGILIGAEGVQLISLVALGVGQTYFLPSGHLVPLVGGCLLAIALDKGLPDKVWTLAQDSAWVPIAMALIVIVALGQRPELPPATGPAFELVTTFAICVLITAGLVQPETPWALRLGALLWLGRRSYGLYLYHGALIVLFGSPLINVRHSVSVALWLGASVVLAEASFRFIESPVLRRGRRWLATRAARSAAEAQPRQRV